MGLLNASMTSAKNAAVKEQPQLTQSLTQSILCAVVGILGGAAGVMLAMALSIIIQTLLSPDSLFFPGVTLVAIISVGCGVVVTSLLTQVAYRIFPAMADTLGAKALEIALVFSVLTGLLQSILFMRGL